MSSANKEKVAILAVGATLGLAVPVLVNLGLKAYRRRRSKPMKLGYWKIRGLAQPIRSETAGLQCPVTTAGRRGYSKRVTWHEAVMRYVSWCVVVGRLLMEYTGAPYEDEFYVQGDAPQYSREEWYSVRRLLRSQPPCPPHAAS